MLFKIHVHSDKEYFTVLSNKLPLRDLFETYVFTVVNGEIDLVIRY